MDTATHSNMRICGEMRELEKPGIVMKQAPMRQMARNNAIIVPCGSVIMKWRPES